MTNKITIGVLVFLVLISGGLGVYSINLNRQIDTLSTEVIAFKGETATGISDVRGSLSTLDSELSAFKGEATTQVSGLESSLSTLDSELTTFKGATTTQVSGLESSLSTLGSELTTFKGATTTQVSGLKTGLSTLDGELTTFKGATATQIAGITTEISQSSINVSKIYESVNQVVVEITDGEAVVGSGFILDSRGYIITAQHVIDGLSEIDVILHDGTIASASIVGSSQYSDVAVLRLKTLVTLEPLELADSNTVALGEPVITLGSPFSLSGTVTSGIVSKTGVAENYRENWLTTNLTQYDAASNPGNSGGPLVNAEGEITGMVVAGTGDGINWAVSSNKLKRVADAIIDFGSFDTATLPGTWSINDLTPEQARDRNMESTNGVLFLRATNLGDVRVDDILVAVDGVAVRKVGDLFNYFGMYKSPGDSITLSLSRQGARVEVALKLEKGWIFQ